MHLLMFLLHNSACKVQDLLHYEGNASTAETPAQYCWYAHAYAHLYMAIHAQACVHASTPTHAGAEIYNAHRYINMQIYKTQCWLCLWWQNCLALPAWWLAEMWSFFSFPGEGTRTAAVGAESQLRQAHDYPGLGLSSLRSLFAATVIVQIICRL